MLNRRCPPGQVSRGTPARCVPVNPLARTPGQHSIGAVFASPMGGPTSTPSGGLYPFSNSAGPSPAPAPSPAPPAPQQPFRIEYSGVIDSFIIETVLLPIPFGIFKNPITQEIYFTLSPGYRDTTGGMGTQAWAQAQSFGFDFQVSVGPIPDHIFLSIYSDWDGPADPDMWGPDTVNIMRTDYVADWPPGDEFTMRFTIDANRVPHLYVDGVEVALLGGAPYAYALPNGNYAAIYGYSFVPGNTVTVDPLVIRSGVIPPPAPV